MVRSNLILRYAAICLLCWFWGSGTCVGQSLAEAMHFFEAPLHAQEIYLPYKADLLREEQLRGQMNGLESGMNPDQVRASLGAPDEIEPILVQGDRTEEYSGFQYVYLLEREKSTEWGKAYEEKCLRINFNMSGLLISAEGHAVPGFKEVVREMGLDFAFSMGLHETVKVNDLLIRLDFVLDADAESAGEASSEADAQFPYGLFSVALSDRSDKLKLSMADGQDAGLQSKTYGQYRITLLAIPSNGRVSLVVK